MSIQKDLQIQVEEYLKAEGYTLQNTKGGYVAANRPAPGGDKDVVLVWLKKKNQSEHALLDKIEDTSSRYRSARCTILVPTSGGLSREFRARASELRVKIRVPVQFFDAPFRVESAPNVTSAVASLREIFPEYIPQPYKNHSKKIEFGDLLADLKNKYITGEHYSNLRIIIGPAGSGKSVFFKSLFTELYTHFLQKKNQQESFPRPVPLLPEYLRDDFSVRTRVLIDDFLRTDVAQPVSSNTFEWMLENGYSMWLFDGLDELYTGDRDFFENILDFLTRPGTKAQFLVCARNSLLTSNDSFARLLEEFPPENNPIEIYELCDWETPSKRALAWRRLEGRIHRKEHDTKKVSDFLETLRRNPTFVSISRLPYYCSLLLDEYREDKSSVEAFQSEFSLLEHVIRRMVEREMAKGLISQNDFETNGLDEWLQTNGIRNYHNSYKGFSIDDVREDAELVLRSDISEDELRNAITSLEQFPLFTKGLVPGIINFKHELISEYLAAKWLSNKLKEDPVQAAKAMGNKLDFYDSLACRFIVADIAANENVKSRLANIVRTRATVNREFAHLLQILVMIDRENAMYQGFLFDTCDLRGIVFENIDFRKASFCNTDLTGTRFLSCNLQETKFGNAILSETSFDELKDTALYGADFSQLEHFDSMSFNGRHINDRDELKALIEKITNTPSAIKDPCPAAMQLLALFRKYVHANGRGRRNELKVDALHRGKHYPNAPRPEECVKQCITYGYLQRPNDRQRVERAVGGHYDEMVNYVKEWKMSSNIRSMLDSLCSIDDCPHVPF